MVGEVIDSNSYTLGKFSGLLHVHLSDTSFDACGIVVVGNLTLLTSLASLGIFLHIHVQHATCFVLASTVTLKCLGSVQLPVKYHSDFF